MRHQLQKAYLVSSLTLLLLSLCSCSRPPISSPSQSLRVSRVQIEDDDLDMQSLRQALQKQREHSVAASAQSIMQFGTRSITKERYQQVLRELELKLEQSQDKKEILSWLNQKFELLEVYGKKDWGQVFLTSYFEPVISGSLVKTNEYTQALYARPDDLLALNLKDFGVSTEEVRAGRARIKGRKVVPYYTRHEIDVEGKLEERKLELCWVTPVDSFFLQIQGSGVIQLPDGRTLMLAYADKNGHPYRAIGAYIKEKFPDGVITLARLKKFLSELNPQERQSYLDLNPSYVFFQISSHRALTSSGIPATAGRTIATDKRYFPKGALAYLKFNRPVFQEPLTPEPEHYEAVSRLVLDQDIGGAITGPGRVDLFWGSGIEAEQSAGVVQGDGELYYLFPRQN